VTAFDDVQRRLGEALDANRADARIDHVLIILPSYSVSESILSHYGNRIASLEHRYLNALLIADRIRSCEILFISTRRPDAATLDGYFDLVPAERRDEVRSRVTVLDIDDGTPRSVAAKLLDREDLLDDIRRRVGARPALMEPWNVTDAEVALAVALGVPINGTRPELRVLGFKSEGRRVLARAGVPIPLGREGVRTVDEVVAAIKAIRAERPAAPGVVIKHDDSGAGDGNVVINFEPLADAFDGDEALRARVAGLPEWYLSDLQRGGVVEERIAGTRFASPSAQVDIRPDGRVIVLATHEQILGGDAGQVYLGCRFPADVAYASALATHAGAVGRELARAGAMGRFSVDFVAASGGDASVSSVDAPDVDGRSAVWAVFGIEINLRKGGTTHPYAALRNVVPGRYDPEAGRWITEDGGTRVYTASDNLVDPAWQGLSPASVIRAVRETGVMFDPATRTGVILHMLAGLAIDGRFGLTAIAEATEAADAMQAEVKAAVDRLAATSGSG